MPLGFPLHGIREHVGHKDAPGTARSTHFSWETFFTDDVHLSKRLLAQKNHPVNPVHPV
jgi:hypothetical protein